MGGFPLPCQVLVELVTDYLEAALPPARRAAVDRHLAACAGCRTYVDQLRTTIQLLRTITAGAGDRRADARGTP